MSTLPIRKVSTLVAFLLSSRPIKALQIPGIGRVSERVLSEMGIQTCGEVYTHRAMIAAMDKHLGLRSLLEAYLGLGSNVVEPPIREGRKSVGVETTFAPMGDKEGLLAKLEKVARELEEDLKRTGWAGRTVTLKYKLHTFQSECNIFCLGLILLLMVFRLHALSYTATVHYLQRRHPFRGA